MSEPKKTQALSLLEGILDETANEAESARLALEEELRRKEEEARQRAEAEEAQRRAEIARRLEAEADRQRTAAERREAALEAMRIEELKAKGLWKEPEPEPKPQVIEAPRPQVNTQQAVAAGKKSNSSALFAAAAAVLILGGGAAGAWFYMNQEYVDATTPFAAETPAVVALADASAVVTFQAIPDPIVQQAAAPAEEPRRDRGTRSRPRSDSGSSDSGSNDRSPTPEFQLGGNLGR